MKRIATTIGILCALLIAAAPTANAKPRHRTTEQRLLHRIRLLDHELVLATDTMNEMQHRISDLEARQYCTTALAMDVIPYETGTTYLLAVAKDIFHPQYWVPVMDTKCLLDPTHYLHPSTKPFGLRITTTP